MRGLPRGAKIISAAAVLALAIAACGGDDKKEPAPGATGPAVAGPATGAITIGHCEPENSFIPTNTNETCGGEVIDAIFTGLVNYDPETAQPENEIAESVTSTDNKVWTIKIKQGWKFHDGTEVKAKNFVDAWNWGSDARNAQLNSYFFDPIAGYLDLQGEDKDGDGKLEVQPKTDKMSGLVVKDDYTFDVTLTDASSSFPQRIGYTAFSPLPDSFFTDPKAFGEKPVGNGPFKFVSWEKKASMVVEADDSYTGTDKAKVKTITFKVYQDQNAQYADLLSDQVDSVDSIPTSALAGEKYKSDLGDRFVNQANGVIYTITVPGYVEEIGAPDKADLRKAISMAIDRPLIIKNIFNDTRVPATGWVSPVVGGYKPEQCGEFCKYNPEKAKELLAKAGGFTGTLSIGYNADLDHKPWVDATCNSIKNAIGVNCVGKPYVDFATLRKDVNADKMESMFRTGWQMDYPAIENFLTPLYATDASANDGNYSNPEFDRLVKLAATQQGEESYATYQQAEALLAVDMPVIPVWYGKTIAGWSNKVTNVRFTPFGTLDLAAITVK
jgi:oligopeptide transport system substrate-binding protein